VPYRGSAGKAASWGEHSKGAQRLSQAFNEVGAFNGRHKVLKFRRNGGFAPMSMCLFLKVSRASVRNICSCSFRKLSAADTPLIEAGVRILANQNNFGLFVQPVAGTYTHAKLGHPGRIHVAIANLEW